MLKNFLFSLATWTQGTRSVVQEVLSALTQGTGFVVQEVLSVGISQVMQEFGHMDLLIFG